ncbi:MAG: Uma2 family endonuclease [Thiomonas sp.]|uniref:Uma2 family endonuclease n=1 Tax=Thiomonas sp. TaxID=2047785 RepID=UPI002A367A66|nr:Uma2 family endonuclease [Thiomonas sp.]MDY0330906.1 Uma2 family endonuclease [Thiomonas sp.]
MSALEKPVFSADDFLAWEMQQPDKHEYLAGEVFAMVGASDAHVTISLNLAAALRAHLRGGPCRAFIADMKLRIDAAQAFFYPDVFVTCSAADAQSPLFKREALLVVEVLSPSTAAYDLGQKFAQYRQLATLQEYVLIDSERVAVDVFRRNAEGRWVLYPYAEGETVALDSVGLSLPVAAIYEDVVFSRGADAEAAQSGASTG